MTLLNTADAVKLGAQNVEAVYLGASQIWPISEAAPAPVDLLEEILLDSPYGYWPMNSNAAVQPDLIGGRDMALTGAAPDVPGANLSLGKAVSFAVDDFGRIDGIDLSHTNKAAMEFWMLWDAYSDNNGLALEFGFGNALGGMVVNPNSSSNGGGNFSAFTRRYDGGFNEELIPRPSAGVWHHYVVVMDRAAAALTDQVKIYVDGALVDDEPFSQVPLDGNFRGPDTLFVMCRAGSSLFGNGDMQHLVVYDHLLSPERIAAHYAKGLGDVVSPTLLEEMMADNPLALWRGGIVAVAGSGSGLGVADASGNNRPGHTFNEGGVAAGFPHDVPSLIANEPVNPGWVQVQKSNVWINSPVWGNTGASTNKITTSYRVRPDAYNNPGGTIWNDLVRHGDSWATFTNLARKTVARITTFDGTQIDVVGNTVLSIGKTYHIMLAYDGRVLSLYVNGLLDGVRDLGSVLGLQNDGFSNIAVGQYSSSNAASDAAFDEIGFYGQGLSAARALAHYNAGVRGVDHHVFPDDLDGYALDSDLTPIRVGFLAYSFNDPNNVIAGVRVWIEDATGVDLSGCWAYVYEFTAAGQAIVAKKAFPVDLVTGWNEVRFSAPVPMASSTVAVPRYYGIVVYMPHGGYFFKQHVFLGFPPQSSSLPAIWSAEQGEGGLASSASVTVQGNGIFKGGALADPSNPDLPAIWNSFAENHYGIDAIIRRA